MEHEGDNYTNRDWCFWYSRRTSGDHPNDKIIENGKNFEKSLRDLRKFDVTRTAVKSHPLM